ncbi:MAG: hypothetical protein AAGK02_17145 [Pseudomonadota bacterium]
MPWLIGVFMRFGLGALPAKIVSWGLVGALAVGLLWWIRHDAYADGVRVENQRWEEALDKVREEAEELGEDVAMDAEERAEEFEEKVLEEKEKLDEAAEAGTDPFDVLFGTE